jgi:hypothetical protein
MSMAWDNVSELRLLTDLLFIPQIKYEYGESRWNDSDRGKPNNSEKSVSQCHFVHHKSNMAWPRARTRAYAVRGRRLTSWAMAWLTSFLSGPNTLFSTLYSNTVFITYFMWETKFIFLIVLYIITVRYLDRRRNTDFALNGSTNFHNLIWVVTSGIYICCRKFRWGENLRRK